MRTIITLFLLLQTFALTGQSSSRLYYYNDAESRYAGELTDSIYYAVKQYLTQKTQSTLQDTLIIKYDYNNERCWNNLDGYGKKYIMRFVTTNQQRIRKTLLARPQVSIFTFREPGDMLNKIKKWDSSVIIDSSLQLFSLLFKERCTCGNSILIMPDKTFVFIRSDSHSEIFNLSKNQIEALRNRN